MNEFPALIDWAQTKTIIGVITGAIALSITAWGFFRKIMQPVKKNWLKIKKAVDELMPNGGESIKDQISFIKSSVDKNSARIFYLLDTADIASYECDLDGSCIGASNSLCAMFGMTAEQMRGSGWLSGLYDQTERDRAYRAWHYSVDSDIPFDFTYRLRNGLLANSVAKPLISPSSGKKIGYVGIVTYVKPDETEGEGI